jgi:quinolinate synthase
MLKSELIEKIKKLKQEKNAVLLAHFYQRPEVQDIADFLGDSLQLSQAAAQTDADIIVFAGVHFMAETAKILSPDKRVVIPDREAGCSLAESCKAEALQKFIEEHPGHTVVSYVNTSAEVKALTDICVTSSNALKIIESLSEDEKIIFGPDRNLGNYIKSLTGRKNMLIWNGACHVHEAFSAQRIVELKNKYTDSKVLAHPECKKPVLLLADFVGSTAALLDFSLQDNTQTYIVATEPGIIHQMQKNAPNKKFIPVPSSNMLDNEVNDSCGACSNCEYMKLTTLEKIYLSLLNEQHEIFVAEDIRKKAEKSIFKMLDLS